MSSIISVENISKLYHIGTSKAHDDVLLDSPHGALRDALGRLLRNPLRWSQRNGIASREELWALKDINFDVSEGEIVGIIGSNGAGKSTLLKILSRITEPTSGRIKLHGKVGSLLEIGTGFHPELTGRENVFLNGAILGMNRKEIDRKFDQIVTFADLEKFLDTPVKHYSSGMYVRLAFAVAAHMDPEILIIDEVLAVGDVSFQKKCLDKMEALAGSGRTLLFVSHSMQSISKLCKRVIYIADGRVTDDGPAEEVIEKYLGWSVARLPERRWTNSDAPGNENVRVSSVRVMKENCRTSGEFTRSEAILCEVRFRVLTGGLRLNPHAHILNSLDGLIFIATNLHDPQYGKYYYPEGEYTAVLKIPKKLLNAGHHYISIYLISDLTVSEACVDHGISFEILEDGSDRGDYTGGWHGAIRPCFDWSIGIEPKCA